MSGIQEGGGDMEMQDAPALHTANGTIVDENSRPGLTGAALICFYVSCARYNNPSCIYWDVVFMWMVVFWRVMDRTGISFRPCG